MREGSRVDLIELKAHRLSTVSVYKTGVPLSTQPRHSGELCCFSEADMVPFERDDLVGESGPSAFRPQPSDDRHSYRRCRRAVSENRSDPAGRMPKEMAISPLSMLQSVPG